MWDRFQKAHSQCIPIAGPMLKEKTIAFAKQRGLPVSEIDFKASNGWLQRFRERNNSYFACISGESGDVPKDVVSDWKCKLPDIVKGYEPCHIYNMDETGLFYRTLPDRTLSIKGDECKGGKKSKDRITVALCVNMVGDFKKPLVIGRAAVPHCMKNVKHSPVTLRYNRMDDNITFQGVDHRLQPEDEKCTATGCTTP